MSIQEARSLIVREIAKYRQISYEDLLRLREEVDTYELSGLSAEVYQIELTFPTPHGFSRCNFCWCVVCGLPFLSNESSVSPRARTY